MARRRGFSQGRHQVATRRNLTWDQGPGQTTATVFSSSTTAVIGSGISPTVGTLTIRRIRGVLEFLQITGAGTGEGFHYAAGIGVASQDAFLAGVAALPNPLDDMTWGWMWHHIGNVRMVTATIADGVNGSSVHERVEIDGKAMRILGENDIVFMSVQAIEAGTATMDVFGNTRLLFAS